MKQNTGNAVKLSPGNDLTSKSPEERKQLNPQS